MDSQTADQNGLNLPSPVDQNGHLQDANSSPQSAATSPDNVAPKTAYQAPQFSPIPLPQNPATDTQNAPNDEITTTNVDVPSTADDGDLIEKEWVLKAKRIVDDTQDDPYKQSQQLNTFKADYLHKRYNKNIKLSE